MLSYMGRKGFVRERILDAAFDSFAKQCYEAVSTRDIAKQANVGHASMYKHFESKEALGKEVYQICLQPVIDGFLEIQENGISTEESVHEICAFLYQLYDERPRALALLIFPPHEFTPWQLAKKNPKSPRSVLLSIVDKNEWFEAILWGAMTGPLQDRYLKRISGEMAKQAEHLKKHITQLIKSVGVK